MKFQPLAGRILVLPDEKVERRVAGFILPENNEKPVTGTVVVGNKTLKKGSRVLFSKFGYDEVELDDETHYIVSEPCVLGIFT